VANQILYGFHNLTSIWDQRVSSGSNIREVETAIAMTMDEHNRQMTSLMSLFTDVTTEYKVRYKVPSIVRSQPLSEEGRARPVRVGGYYDIAFPMQRSGNAWGTTYEGSLKLTVGEVNNLMTTMTMGDKLWMRDHILAALFTNASWTYTDEEHGALTIKGLANGDSDTFLFQNSTAGGSIDTHYFGQASAIDDSNDPFANIYSELSEHPNNAGEVIALVPTNLKTAIQALASYYPANDANIRQGGSTAILTGNLGVPVPGEVFGYHDDKVWLVEWKALPDNYIVGVMSGGDRSLAMRQDTVAELQGFRFVAERNDHPWYEKQYLRKAGFGAQNRVGSVVYRIGNGTYAIPTGFSSPMA